MNFLDALGGVGGDDDFHGSGALELAAGFAEQEQSVHVKTLGGFDGADDIGGVAAGADGQEQVSGLAIGFDAAGEDFVPAIVIGDSGQM